MYKKFFDLKRNPFEIAPDPHFLFFTERHREALASIYYGICRRKGFVLMTGEVGTGKTLLVRCLLELLTRQQVAFANVFNPLLSAENFLRYVASDLGITLADRSKSTLLFELNNFLIARLRKGLTTVLIVDEAQNLELEVLEEIRLLTNLETAKQKLLQILLVGQPELEPKLDCANLRQLKQRVALRCRLEALEQQEVQGYIVRRLTLGGMATNPEAVFSPGAVAAIYHYSQGIPRLVNTICENSLIAAFAQKARTVSAQMVEEISAEFRLGRWARPSEPTAVNETVAAARFLLQFAESLKIVSHGDGRQPAKTYRPPSAGNDVNFLPSSLDISKVVTPRT
ncbi:MAG: AAA family ATPase [Candidatus Sulfotelmatobacter sp.]